MFPAPDNMFMMSRLASVLGEQGEPGPLMEEVGTWREKEEEMLRGRQMTLGKKGEGL